MMSLKRKQSKEAKRTPVSELEEEKTDTLEEIGTVELIRIVPSIKNSGVSMRSSNTLNLYARPGPIENHTLLQKKNCMLLKPNLIEHHDYVALPAQIWRHIYAWYSSDWSIVRFLRKDSGIGVILDLYPNELPIESRTETAQSN